MAEAVVQTGVIVAYEYPSQLPSFRCCDDRLNPPIGHLHKGYVGLIGLMERMPQRWTWAAEPPQVFRADE